MNKSKLFFITAIITIVSVFSFTSCKKDKNEENIVPEDSFDKRGMLSNIGENIIIPAYTALKTSLDSLQYYNNQFVSNPTLTTLAALQLKFQNAYSAYQWCTAFEFGPAEDQIIRANFNTFPCDTVQINNNITLGVYDLSSASNIDAKGFPALEFLLYGNSQNNNSIVLRYSTSTNAKNYLKTLVDELKYKTDAINTGWASNAGNYITTFKNNTGSDVGGSIGMLVNQLNYDFELLKNSKIGIPLGKKTLGTPLSDKVEAFYSGKSLALVIEQINSIENIYLGRNALNIDGLGLDDYLVHVNAQHSTGALNDVIKNKFISAKVKLAAIPGTLSQAVVNNPTIVNAAYAELQALVVLLKVDVPSALGVLITYQDNDGD